MSNVGVWGTLCEIGLELAPALAACVCERWAARLSACALSRLGPDVLVYVSGGASRGQHGKGGRQDSCFSKMVIYNLFFQLQIWTISLIIL